MLIKFNAYLFAFFRNACEDAIYEIEFSTQTNVILTNKEQ